MSPDLSDAMTSQELVVLAIKGSVFLLSLSVGLDAQGREATHLLRHPGLLVRSLGAMNVVMPAFVVAATTWVSLPPAVRVALLAIALSPVPPVLPRRQTKAGGEHAYTVGLLVAACASSAVIIPVATELIGRVFDRDLFVPMRRVLPILLASVLAPLSAGMLLRHYRPGIAQRIAGPATRGATLVLVLAAMPVLVAAGPEMRELIGSGTLLVLALFSVIGLLVGHALGAPDPDERTVLALATASRHPGVAVAIASVNFPSDKAATAVVILHLLVGAAASIPYVVWRGRLHASREAAMTQGGHRRPRS